MGLDLSADATEILTELGSSDHIKLVVKSDGVLDPVEGETTGSATVDINCVGAVVRIDQKLIDGERILASDKMAIIDNQKTPTMENQIKVDDKVYEIIAINEINHAGITQLWTIIYRA